MKVQWQGTLYLLPANQGNITVAEAERSFTLVMRDVFADANRRYKVFERARPSQDGGYDYEVRDEGGRCCNARLDGWRTKSETTRI